MSTKDSRKVEEFLEVLSSSPDRILILPHNNPDPDSLATAAAVRFLIEKKLARESVIGLNGIIGRAENRAMVSLLGIPLVPSEDIFPQFDGSAVLVDTQPGQNNQSLPAGIKPLAVIDHHPDRGHTGSIPFVDLRENYGATSTIAAGYLEEANLPIHPIIATALFYGISSETQDLSRETVPADVLASQLLYPHVDKRLLGEIENPPRSRDYFRLMSKATEAALLSGNVVVTVLEAVPYPDAVAEVADYLMGLETARWSVCVAPHGNFVYISIRSKDPQAHAGRLLASLLTGGQAGGHGRMAGGMFKKKAGKQWKAEASSLVKDFLKAVGQTGSPAEPLLS